MLPKTTIMLLAFRKMIKANIVVAERNNPNSYSKRISNILRKYASRADGWVFQTNEAREWYGKSIENCKKIIIPNAINPTFLRARRYSGERRKIVAGVGRLNNQKNFGLLIKAFARISDQFLDYNLVIYGEGEKEGELKEIAKKLGIQGRVIFPGNIQNIAEEIEKNTMFVLSSDFEGMPNALMEAMALGLPCIATNCPCGGPKYLIQDGVNGLLVPVDDEKKMADAMRSILSDSQKAEALGCTAMRIANRLDPNKIYSQWEEFINSIDRYNM